MFGGRNDDATEQADDASIAVPASTVDAVVADTAPAASAPAVPAPASAPALSSSDLSATSEPASAPAVPDNATTALATDSGDDLLAIKQQALQQLSPLVGHLDQSPEDKFRTTMMMIQASDDQSLVKEAYEAAQQITDEKARAQALLDIVNEINYFTQQNQSGGGASAPA